MLHHSEKFGIAPWDLAGIPETAGHEAWLGWMNIYATAENRYHEYQKAKAKQQRKR